MANGTKPGKPKSLYTELRHRYLVLLSTDEVYRAQIREDLESEELPGPVDWADYLAQQELYMRRMDLDIQGYTAALSGNHERTFDATRKKDELHRQGGFVEGE